MPWKDLETADPPLAAFGRERLHGRVAYLATSRANGAPRVHPVTPIIGDGRCFLFMEPTSPKGRDLERDARFALHCAVSDDTGGSGEFALAGIARRETSAETRGLACSLRTLRRSGTSCSNCIPGARSPRSMAMAARNGGSGEPPLRDTAPARAGSR